PDNYHKKAKDLIFEYALIYFELYVFDKLVKLKYNKALEWNKEGGGRINRKYPEYFTHNVKQVESNIKLYGPDFRNEFNLTPLMMAGYAGSAKIVKFLNQLGANNDLMDNLGRQAFQVAFFKFC